MHDKRIVLDQLVVRQVLNVQVHQVCAVLDRLERFFLLLIASLDQLLGEEQDGLLRLLNLLSCEVRRHEDVVAGPFDLLLLVELRDVLHVDQVANLLVEEDLEDLDLHVSRLVLLVSILVLVYNLVDQLRLRRFAKHIIAFVFLAADVANLNLLRTLDNIQNAKHLLMFGRRLVVDLINRLLLHAH